MVWLNAIKGFLFSKSSTLLYLGIALAVAIAGGYIYYQDKKIKSQEKEIITLVKENSILGAKLNDALLVNKDNEKKFEKYKVETNKAFELLTKQHEKELSKAIEYTKILGEVKNVKKSDDGIAAPILVNTFDRLRELQSKNTKDNNKDKNSKTASTK